ncbi:hypothetical protein BC830DRAFT_1164869 [Chytriomyces sp. MP71]|nr:hypothetical protein BC830DRAFT_1164869 [Chytriomyces sp. MP71]
MKAAETAALIVALGWRLVQLPSQASSGGAAKRLISVKQGGNDVVLVKVPVNSGLSTQHAPKFECGLSQLDQPSIHSKPTILVVNNVYVFKQIYGSTGFQWTTLVKSEQPKSAHLRPSSHSPELSAVVETTLRERMSVLASVLSELATRTAPKQSTPAVPSLLLSSFSSSSTSSEAIDSVASSLTSSSLSASTLQVPPLRPRPSIASRSMSSFPVALSGIPSTLSLNSVARTTSTASSICPESDALQISLAALARLDTLIDMALFADSILEWSDAVVSTLALVSFWLICAYPVLAFILPQLYVATWILFRYISRGGALMALREPPPLRTDLQAVMDSIVSDRFARNLQVMQTWSAHFCATYDALESLYAEHLTWRDPVKTGRVAKVLLTCVPLALAGWMYLPAWCIQLSVALAGGCILLERTWIYLFCVHVVPKVLWRRVEHFAERFIADLPLPGSIVDAMAASGIGWVCVKRGNSLSTDGANMKEANKEDPNRITIELLENQRWWAVNLNHQKTKPRDPAGHLKNLQTSMSTRRTLSMEADGLVYSFVLARFFCGDLGRSVEQKRCRARDPFTHAASPFARLLRKMSESTSVKGRRSRKGGRRALDLFLKVRSRLGYTVAATTNPSDKTKPALPAHPAAKSARFLLLPHKPHTFKNWVCSTPRQPGGCNLVFTSLVNFTMPA